MCDKIPIPEWQPWTPLQEPGVSDKISSNLLVAIVQIIMMLVIVGVLLVVAFRFWCCDARFIMSFFTTTKPEPDAVVIIG